MFAIIALCALLSTAAAFNSAAPVRRGQVVMMAGKSQSLPFMPQPPNLVGMAGDVGKYYKV